MHGACVFVDLELGLSCIGMSFRARNFSFQAEGICFRAWDVCFPQLNSVFVREYFFFRT